MTRVVIVKILKIHTATKKESPLILRLIIALVSCLIRSVPQRLMELVYTQLIVGSSPTRPISGCLGRLVMHLICNQETIGSIPIGSLKALTASYVSKPCVGGSTPSAPDRGRIAQLVEHWSNSVPC